MKRLLVVALLLTIAIGSAQAVSTLDYSYVMLYRMMKANKEYEPEIVNNIVLDPIGLNPSFYIQGTTVVARPEKLDIFFVGLEFISSDGKRISGKEKERAIAAISALENSNLLTDSLLEMLGEAPLGEAEKIFDLIDAKLTTQKIKSFKDNETIHETDNCKYTISKPGGSVMVLVFPIK